MTVDRNLHRFSLVRSSMRKIFRMLLSPPSARKVLPVPSKQSTSSRGGSQPQSDRCSLLDRDMLIVVVVMHRELRLPGDTATTAFMTTGTDGPFDSREGLHYGPGSCMGMTQIGRLRPPIEAMISIALPVASWALLAAHTASPQSTPAEPLIGVQRARPGIIAIEMLPHGQSAGCRDAMGLICAAAH
jgi:hypothetical protein